MEDQGVEANLIHVRPNARVDAVPDVHELCLKLVDVVVQEVEDRSFGETVFKIFF